MSVSPRFLALNAFAFAFHHAINLAESSGEDRRWIDEHSVTIGPLSLFHFLMPSLIFLSFT